MGGLYGYHCADCPKRKGSHMSRTRARRGASSHARLCPSHHVFILREGLATLEMWGGHTDGP